MSKTEQILAKNAKKGKGKFASAGAKNLQALINTPGGQAFGVKPGQGVVPSVTGAAPANNTMTIPLQSSSAAAAGPSFSSQVIPADPNLEDAAPVTVGGPQPNYLIPGAAIAAAGALYFAGILTPKAAALAAGGSAAAYALYLRTR